MLERIYKLQLFIPKRLSKAVKIKSNRTYKETGGSTWLVSSTTFERAGRKSAPTSCQKKSISFDSAMGETLQTCRFQVYNTHTRKQEAAVGWSASGSLRDLLPERIYKLRLCIPKRLSKAVEIKSTALTRIQEAAVGWSAPHLLIERGASQPRPLARENL